MNKFGGFVHTSPLCSSDPTGTPLLHLASNVIRDYFGPTVQTVADCLLSEAACSSGGDGSSLVSILQKIRKHCSRDINETRVELAKHIPGSLQISKARGPESSGFVVSDDACRAALLVLVQHSIATAIPVAPEHNVNGKQAQVTYRYKIDASRARMLIRYPRFIEYAKRSHDETAATIVQELLIVGRMTIMDVILETRNSIQTLLSEKREQQERTSLQMVKDESTAVKDDSDNAAGTFATAAIKSELSSNCRTKEEETDDLYSTIIDALKKLIDGGYIEMVRTLEKNVTDTLQEESELKLEANSGGVSGRKRKLQEIQRQEEGMQISRERSIVKELLAAKGNCQNFLPPGSVWRVNVQMFHSVLRAFVFGRLVAERFGHKVDSIGSVVSAALKFAAFQKYSPLSPTATMDENRRLETIGLFSPEEILHFLPTPVLHALKNKPGGATANLSRTLVHMAQQCQPKVVNEVESSHGHSQGGRFEIPVRQLLDHIQRKLMHQYVTDAHGEVAARVCSILEAKGDLEAEGIADAAMVPVKEVREVLYDLFQAKLITLINLQQGKQHNAATAIYLWGIDRRRMTQTVTDNVALALHNIRLRRQHEMEVGKDWVERAKESSVDENEHELDKLNYNKFCQGLERLDSAALQLDESLMVMKDFL